MTGSEFDLVLDPNSEVLRIGLVVVPGELDLVTDLEVLGIALAFNELLVERFTNIKLDGIIASSDGFDIPLDEVVGLHTSDVININEHEK